MIAAARLLAAEHGSRAVGTVHLLAALLADGEADGAGEGESVDGSLPVRLLREEGADPAELSRQLGLRPGA